MKSYSIIKEKIFSQSLDRLGNALIVVKIHFFVFHAAPEALHENIIQGASATIHADRDSVLFENSGKGIARELGALISVKDRRFPMMKCSLESADAKIAFHRR